MSWFKEMFFGGTETTSNTIEWGMSELVRNPEKMKKLRNEVDRVVGHARNVEDEDLNNMPYLLATVKETLRLHPVFPMLLPRNSMQETEFMGYVVPKNTQIFVNAWAIQRIRVHGLTRIRSSPRGSWIRMLITRASILSCSRLGRVVGPALGWRWGTEWLA